MGNSDIDIKLQNISKVNYGCFILHNYCETRDSAFNFWEIKSQVARISNNIVGNNGPNNFYSENSDEGIVVGKVISNYIKDCSTSIFSKLTISSNKLSYVNNLHVTL